MLTIKWLLKSDLVLLFFPLLSSEKLWGSYSKNLICFSHCLFLTGNINHRCGDFPNLKGEGGGGSKLYTKLCQKKTIVPLYLVHLLNN